MENCSFEASKGPSWYWGLGQSVLLLIFSCLCSTVTKVWKKSVSEYVAFTYWEKQAETSQQKQKAYFDKAAISDVLMIRALFLLNKH